MTDLSKLIEAVETGKIQSKFDPVFERALYRKGDDMMTRVYLAAQAYKGSVDAALAFREELFGDRWGFVIRKGFAKLLHHKTWKKDISAFNDVTSRAMLLATLKVYEWESEQKAGFRKSEMDAAIVGPSYHELYIKKYPSGEVRLNYRESGPVETNHYTKMRHLSDREIKYLKDAGVWEKEQ